MKINNRLTKIAELIEDDSSVMDIGCDHALLDIYLIKEKQNIHILATDNKEGPLEKAKDNIKKYNTLGQIALSLGDGLEPITKNIDTVIISGMGGLTINKILLTGKDKLPNINTLILSPNSDYKYVRKVLTVLGFYIKEEYIIKDNNKYYLIIKALKGHKHYSQKEYNYGPVLLKHKSKEYLEYLNLELTKKKLIYKLLPKNDFINKFKIKHIIKEINNLVH